jgi:tetratricopeptide (TPR) repeat protein
MRETLNEYLAIGDFDNKIPKDINLILGSIFEFSRELNCIDSLNKGIEISSSISLQNFSDDYKMTFFYNLSNAWSYKKNMKQVLHSAKYWEFESQELTQEILNCRKALLFTENSSDLKRRCEILTNLGNDLSHLGRYSEAIELWNKALELDKNFSMAIGNLGFGLFYYAQILYDDGHKAYFLKESYLNLKRVIESDDIYLESKTSFKNIISFIEKRIDFNFLNTPNENKNYSLGNTDEEIKYRKWCLENCLFINPLNDIYKETIVAHDILSLPTIVVKKEDNDIYNYHSFYNQMKQEFCSARYLFYESISNRNIHFSDKGNLIIDTLDYSTYSMNVEKIKIAFKLFYSILDKIAYMINSYFYLGHKPHEISFRKVWLDKNKLNSKIGDTQNWGLRGLFWLSKDFSEKDDLYSLLEPDAKELCTIRNFIEHKSFKLIEFGTSGISKDGFTYTIERSLFVNKTFKLMKTIRASLIYTSLMINIEEKQKGK